MALKKKPFVAYNIGEKKTDTFTVRVNPEQRAWLEEIKEDLNIKSDSKALKIAAFVGRNVLHQLFTRPLLRYLFKKERVKLEHYKNF